MQRCPRLLKAFVGGYRLASLSYGSLVASCAGPSTSAPSLGGRYPLHRYYGPIRLPSRPVLSLAGVQLAAAAAGMGLPCCVVFLADVPSPLPRRTRRSGLFGRLTALCMRRRRPSLSASKVGVRTSCFEACSAFTVVTARLLAESPCCDPLTSEASADSLPPRLFRLLPGGTINLPGGTRTRWKPTPLHGAQPGMFSSPRTEESAPDPFVFPKAQGL